MQTGKTQQTGFTYLGLLFSIAIIGIFLAQIGIIWSQASQREKEQQLLFVGNQYRLAIMLYYLRTPGEVKKYPATLEELITDNRFNPPAHYLRQHYLNPLTNTDWGIIPAPQGGIMGVYSKFSGTPLKISNFSYANRMFEGANKYSDWRFEYAQVEMKQAQGK